MELRSMRTWIGQTPALGLVALVLLAGCGQSEVAEDASPAPATETEAAERTEAAADTVTIRAVDYEFREVPGTVEPGTTIRLENQSEDEAHEILAFRLPEGEERPVEELVSLPPERFEELDLQLRGVALAPPEGTSAEGPAPPLTLEEPGRYALVCLLPTDAPPGEVLEAAREFLEAGAPAGGEPDYPETGPPHAHHGMFAEITVAPSG